ncbi:MAG: ribonuclease P protein component [Bacilli bacterium]|nr:ribonuclease P protein component [Bacilli bacterium]
MKKLYIVKKTKDFEDIINNGTNLKNKLFVVHCKNNNLPYDRFGISVSKKLGNAVFRNYYKRIIRSIIDNYKKDYVNSKDYIIILRKEAINKSYSELENELIALLNKEG